MGNFITLQHLLTLLKYNTDIQMFGLSIQSIKPQIVNPNRSTSPPWTLSHDKAVGISTRLGPVGAGSLSIAVGRRSVDGTTRPRDCCRLLAKAAELSTLTWVWRSGYALEMRILQNRTASRPSRGRGLLLAEATMTTGKENITLA